jgi:DNA-directed RNA polymerase subunit RPC12/RpoP
MIRFACPRCRQEFTVPDDTAGRKSTCPRCQQRLLVPFPPHTQAVPAPFISHEPDAPPQDDTVPEYTVRCWKCGDRVPEGQAVRRDVRTGTLGGVLGNFNGNMGWGLAGQWSRVDVCTTCADRMDRENASWRRAWLFVIAFNATLFGLLVLLGFLAGRR